MNTDRLLREVEKRLAHLAPKDRGEALDAIREEIARERRRLASPDEKVEVERTRRLEAETLREALEAINRQARLEETLDEVLKQLSRIVSVDSCSLALLEGEGRFRVVAGRGFPVGSPAPGGSFRDALSDALRDNRRPVSIADVREEEGFAPREGGEPVRSWAGIPLLVEGDMIGLLGMARHRVEPFDEGDLHRAKAVAFSGAAAIRKAQVLEQVERYAGLMERVVEVDHAVFAGRGLEDVARLILEGARRLGSYPGGLFALAGPGRRVVAAAGALEKALGRQAPAELVAGTAARLEPARVAELGQTLGLHIPAQGMCLVPLTNANTHLGTLALLDPDGFTPDDRLLEAYASRAATAYLTASRSRAR